VFSSLSRTNPGLTAFFGFLCLVLQDRELTNVFPHRTSFRPEYPSGCFAKADNFMQYRDVMESDDSPWVSFVATIKSIYSAFHLSNWNAKNFNAAHPLPVVGGLNEMERGALNGLQQSKSTTRAHGNLIGRNVRGSIEIADDPKFKDPVLDAAASFTHNSLERLFWLQTQVCFDYSAANASVHQLNSDERHRILSADPLDNRQAARRGGDQRIGTRGV